MELIVCFGVMALETLVRAGLPAQLEDALALVEQLQRPSERLWALTSLAAREGSRQRREKDLSRQPGGKPCRDAYAYVSVSA